MNYQVVSVVNSDWAAARDALEKRVNDLLKEGWVLQGGVSVSTTSYEYVDTYIFAQALVK